MKSSPENIKDKLPILQISNLSVGYKIRKGEVLAIDDVSFDINQGDCCGIVGESGCGKSTLAWAIINFLGNNGYIKRGSIKFQGTELSATNAEQMRQLRGNRISMVFQDPMQALNPSLRINRQLIEVLTIHSRLSENEAKKRCLMMLERVYMPDPEQVMKRYPHQLSGGQQQRVVIAMAMLNNPSLLILDEPTTALDVTVEATVLDLIDDLRKEFKMSVMLITHNLGIVARICSKVGVMYSGELIEFSTVEKLFQKPLHPYTHGLLRCVPKLQSGGSRKRLQPIPGRVPPPSDRPIGCGFWPRCFFSVERCQLEKPSLQSSEDIDTRVRCHFYQEIFHNRLQDTDSLNNLNETNSKNKSVHAPILSVSKLTTYYPVRSANLKELFHFKPKKNVKALENATFNLLKMGTLGIVGESGCGKSTLVKTLIGLEERTNGTITFQGNKLAAKISHRNQKQIQEMQMVFQNPDSTMNPCYTVGQQIARPIRKFGIVPKNQIRNKVIKLLEAIRLSEAYYDRFPIQLSGGEKQRVGIARALAINPDLILCDEPVSALDVSVQAAILNLLLEIQHDFNTTYIFISHDLSVVRLISDFICVMYLGNIVEIGPAESIFSPPNHPYTEALLSAIPIPDPKVIQNRIRIEGSVPSAINPPQGCRFRTRCHRKNLLSDPTICQIVPSMQEDKNGHKIFCHIPIEILTNIEPVVKK